jgi:hypothetical protein
MYIKRFAAIDGVIKNQLYMQLSEFEPIISVFERAKTVLASDNAATLNGVRPYLLRFL